MPELSEATLSDIAAELRRRGLHFALVVDQLHRYKPGGDIPSEERQTVYGSDDDPVYRVCLFCDGIQWALNDAPTNFAMTACLSAQTNMLKEGIWRLTDFTKPREE